MFGEESIEALSAARFFARNFNLQNNHLILAVGFKDPAKRLTPKYVRALDVKVGKFTLKKNLDSICSAFSKSLKLFQIAEFINSSAWIMSNFFGLVVIGPPGSGKTTFCEGMSQFLKSLGREVSIVNLDPANENTPYPPGKLHTCFK